MARQAYIPSVQKPTDPKVGCRTALPMAVAAIMHVETKSACSGSRHHRRGFLFHDGRGSGSAFQRLIEYVTAQSAKGGMTSRMIKHKTASGLVWRNLSGVSARYPSRNASAIKTKLTIPHKLLARINAPLIPTGNHNLMEENEN